MDYLHKIDRVQMYGAIIPNRLYSLHGWPLYYVSITADLFNARANRARQLKKGPCVRRGRKYP